MNTLPWKVGRVRSRSTSTLNCSYVIFAPPVYGCLIN